MGNSCIYKAIGYYIPFELEVNPPRRRDPLGDMTPIIQFLEFDLVTLDGAREQNTKNSNVRAFSPKSRVEYYYYYY